MEADRCPACGRSPAVAGQLMSGNENWPGTLFVPNHRRGVFRPIVGAGVEGGFHACAGCGLVWSTLDPARLRDVIREHGAEVVQDAVDELDSGRYRDLPDTDLAREVADKVAEIDALVRSGKLGASRRYRELRGVTWDQAHQDIARWPHLPRDEKLALFGWTPKAKKAPPDDLEAPFA